MELRKLLDLENQRFLVPRCRRVWMIVIQKVLAAYAAFTLNGFDDQERNLTVVKTDFQVLNTNFRLAILSRISILFINNISRPFDNTEILLYKFFVRYLAVKPACVNAALVIFKS